MNNATTKNNRIVRRFPDRCLPAIIAVGSSLATLPAAALELGELTVQSRLGQPLRASIAYALSPTEDISNNCVTMRPGPSLSGLPGAGATKISVANGVIMLSGSTPIREPMVSAHVVVNCPYSANLSREYLLFIDPVSSADNPVYQDTVVTRQATPLAEPVAVAPAAIAQPVASVPSAPVARDIETSTRYQVQRGDSLSEIAARIQNRPVGLWPAVNAIFEANPDSFTNNDPNNLKAGSWLLIPSFDGNAVVVADAEPADLAGEDLIAGAYEPLIANQLAPIEETQVAAENQPAAIEVSAPAEAAAPAIVLDDLNNPGVTVSESQPGNIILDTDLPGPTTASQSPNGTTAVIAARNPVDNGRSLPSWIAWLAGSGIAIVFALMMYRRRLGGQPETQPAAPAENEHHQRRFSDAESTDINNIDALQVDYDISDDSPTEENLVLDADLILGTGLSDGSQVDILPDFVAAAIAPDELTPSPTPEYTILESEVLPESDNDDYDMSVIIDATKLPQADDVDEHDFKAVEVAGDDDMWMTQTFMAKTESDYLVLERDYEDEMTATQALNLEVAHAAAELTARMDIEGISNNGKENGEESDDKTTALPMATVTELGATARNQKLSESDEIESSEAITINTNADDDTVEMPVESGKAS